MGRVRAGLSAGTRAWLRGPRPPAIRPSKSRSRSSPVTPRPPLAPRLPSPSLRCRPLPGSWRHGPRLPGSAQGPAHRPTAWQDARPVSRPRGCHQWHRGGSAPRLRLQANEEALPLALHPQRAPLGTFPADSPDLTSGFQLAPLSPPAHTHHTLTFSPVRFRRKCGEEIKWGFHTTGVTHARAHTTHIHLPSLQ